MTLEELLYDGMIDFCNKIIEHFPADSDYVRFAGMKKKKLEREREGSKTHIKRRVYDPRPLYPEEDEVLEFTINR